MVVSRMLCMGDHNCWMVLPPTQEYLLSLCIPAFLYLLCHSFTGLPPVVLRRVIEILTYLATNHPAVANLLFYFDPSSVVESASPNYTETKKDKYKEKNVEGVSVNPSGSSLQGDVPLILFLKLLNRPLSLQSIAHLDQVDMWILIESNLSSALGVA